MSDKDKELDTIDHAFKAEPSDVLQRPGKQRHPHLLPKSSNYF